MIIWNTSKHTKKKAANCFIRSIGENEGIIQLHNQEQTKGRYAFKTLLTYLHYYS